MPYGVDLHSVLVLVNAVDDPVGPAPRGVVTIEGFIKWLADAVRAGSERPVDRLHGSGSDIKGWILVQVTPCLSGEDDGVRSFSLWSGRVRITGHDVRRRRCSSSAPSLFQLGAGLPGVEGVARGEVFAGPPQVGECLVISEDVKGLLHGFEPGRECVALLMDYTNGAGRAGSSA